MHLVYGLIALDIATERARHADEFRRRFTPVPPAGSQRHSAIRRGLAQTLAAIARGSASAAHRLDAFTAEDLRGTLAAGK